MELLHVSRELMGATDRNGRCARFLLDGKVIEARDVAPTTTLLQFLRGPLGRHGTKEGCAEGDCGACTVVLGELGESGTRYRAVNSCIRFVHTVDGKEVVTVESLRGKGGALHPVQRAMVDAHGSQCGFCTPGFVMSLFALYLEREQVTREDAVEALSGNLCRCTGYRPILDAAHGMHALPAPAAWSRDEANSAGRRERLQQLAKTGAGEPVRLPGYFAPRTLTELATHFADAPDSTLLAGGTDVGLWVTKQLRDLPAIVYLGDVAELQSIEEREGSLEIGAAVSLADAYAAIVARYPMLAELASRFGSVPVRNSGTLCGNLGNGSPIGDSMPILIALGAEVLLRHRQSERSLPLEALYLDYQKKALTRGEFIRAVRIPLAAKDTHVGTYKISKRFDQDISAVCAAFAIKLKAGRVAEARIAYGGMAAIPKRAAKAEAALVGKPWAMASIEAAAAALADDFRPLSDMRASATYRANVAGALLKRFFLASDPSRVASPLRVEEIRVVVP